MERRFTEGGTSARSWISDTGTATLPRYARFDGRESAPTSLPRSSAAAGRSMARVGRQSWSGSRRPHWRRGCAPSAFAARAAALERGCAADRRPSRCAVAFKEREWGVITLLPSPSRQSREPIAEVLLERSGCDQHSGMRCGRLDGSGTTQHLVITKRIFRRRIRSHAVSRAVVRRP